MVVRTKTTTVNSIEQSSASNPHTLRGGYADIHESLGISTLDLSDFLVASIRGEEYVAPAATPAVADRPEMSQATETRQTRERVEPQEVKTKRALGRRAFEAAWQRKAALPIAAGAAAIILVNTGDTVSKAWNASQHREIIETASTRLMENPVYERTDIDARTVWMPTGGFGQGQAPPVEEMRTKGYQEGMITDPIYYSGNILGPLNGGETMISSEEGGVAYALPRVQAALAAGQQVNIPAYSEGTGVQRKLSWALYEANGNKTPAGVKYIQVEGPYHPGGIFHSKFTKAVNPALDMVGIDHGDGDNDYAPDADVEYVYFADSAWAGNGNENFTTYIKNMLALGAGSHEIPNPDDPASQGAHVEVFRDHQGRLHKVLVRDNDVFLQAIERAGIHIMDSADANAAINAFFPQNIDPESTEQLRPDVRAGMFYAARAIDRQIDPSGNVHIFENIVNQMPESWKDLAQDAFDGINNSMDKLANAINDPTPENIAIAFQAITHDISKVMTDLGVVMQNPLGDIKNVAVNTAADQIYQSTGIDMHTQLQQLADAILQPHPELQQLAQTWVQPTAASVDIKASVDAQVPAVAVPQIDTVTQAFIDAQTALFPSSLDVQASVQSNPGPDAAANISLDNGNASATFNIQPDLNGAVQSVTDQLPQIALNIPPVDISTSNTAVPEVIAPAPAPTEPAEAAPVQVQEPIAPTREYTPPAPAPVQEYTPPPAPAPAPVEPAEVAPPAPVVEAPAPVVVPEPAPAPAPEPAPAPAPAPFVNPLQGFSDAITNIFSPHRNSSPAPAPAPAMPDGFVPAAAPAEPAS